MGVCIYRARGRVDALARQRAGARARRQVDPQIPDPRSSDPQILRSSDPQVPDPQILRSQILRSSELSGIIPELSGEDRGPISISIFTTNFPQNARVSAICRKFAVNLHIEMGPRTARKHFFQLLAKKSWGDPGASGLRHWNSRAAILELIRKYCKKCLGPNPGPISISIFTSNFPQIAPERESERDLQKVCCKFAHQNGSPNCPQTLFSTFGQKILG